MKINGNSQMKKSKNNNQKALELSQRKNKIEEKSVLLPRKNQLSSPHIHESASLCLRVRKNTFVLTFEGKLIYL